MSQHMDAPAEIFLRASPGRPAQRLEDRGAHTHTHTHRVGYIDPATDQRRFTQAEAPHAPSRLGLMGFQMGLRGVRRVVPRWFRGRFRVVPGWFRVVPGGSAPMLTLQAGVLGAGPFSDNFVVSLVFSMYSACRTGVVDPDRPTQRRLRARSKMWCCSLLLKF